MPFGSGKKRKKSTKAATPPKPSFGKGFVNPRETPAMQAITTPSYHHLARGKSMKTLITDTQHLYESRRGDFDRIELVRPSGPRMKRKRALTIPMMNYTPRGSH